MANEGPKTDSGVGTVAVRPTLRGHLAIARPDHWIKNVFVIPGIIVAVAIDPDAVSPALWPRVLAGFVSVCLITSSNYVINELLDAPFDRAHPTKCRRPVPSGQVSVSLAYVQWIALALVGLAVAAVTSALLAATMAGLWLMGCLYNVRPVRAKDRPFIDVLSESVNNPLRLLAGWFMVEPNAISPASLLLSYWMLGAYFMALKRFAEFRMIDNSACAARYRRSFAYYTEERLLISVMFYASAAMLFFGAFTIRYRLELILSFPLVALLMAIYLHLAFKDESPVQAPERLYKEKGLMLAGCLCAVVMAALMFIDVPALYDVFQPTAPTPWVGS